MESWVYCLVIGTVFLLPKLQYIFWRGIPQLRKNRHSKSNDNLLKRIFFHSLGSFALYWHDLSIDNPEVIDQVLDSGHSCLLLGYHSRCTIDLAFFLSIIQPIAIVTPLFFTMPFADKLCSQLGLVPAKSLHKNMEDKNNSNKNDNTDEDEHSRYAPFMQNLAQTQDPVMLLPGGIFECLKPYHQRYRVHWKSKPGFARALERYMPTWSATKGVSVVPFFTRHCEDIYYTSLFWYDQTSSYHNYYHDLVKKGYLLAIPLALISGLACLGCLLYPKPYKLVTICGQPIPWEAHDTAESFAEKVVTALQKLIDENQTSSHHGMFSPHKDQSYFERCFRALFTVWMVVQNLFFTLVLVVCMSATWIPIIVYMLYRQCMPKLKLKRD